jgi:hypothetical protein
LRLWVWDPTVFTKNRERLQEGDVFQKCMTKLLKHDKVKPLLSDEHFSVDGTLIEAWASHKSFKPKQAKTDDDGADQARPPAAPLLMYCRSWLSVSPAAMASYRSQ